MAVARRAGDRETAWQLWHDARTVARATPHWLRHSLADRWLKAGADVRSVMAQAGWRDPRSVMGYTHGAEAHRREMARNAAPWPTLTKAQ